MSQIKVTEKRTMRKWHDVEMGTVVVVTVAGGSHTCLKTSMTHVFSLTDMKAYELPKASMLGQVRVLKSKIIIKV